ncbi:hypothetical protein Fmac_014722 [Flemingia macrophylla]|uniref:Uncharacterized protein n=1 Tax=Flemingia macrophylla TaxID=520843 RepID=A0ABD1MCK9_9FABA
MTHTSIASAFTSVVITSAVVTYASLTLVFYIDYAGCGKMTIVRYVVRRLGLHVIDLEALVKEIVGLTYDYMPRDICAWIADVGAHLFPKVNKDVPNDVDNSFSSKMAVENNHGEIFTSNS